MFRIPIVALNWWIWILGLLIFVCFLLSEELDPWGNCLFVGCAEAKSTWAWIPSVKGSYVFPQTLISYYSFFKKKITYIVCISFFTYLLHDIFCLGFGNQSCDFSKCCGCYIGQWYVQSLWSSTHWSTLWKSWFVSACLTGVVLLEFWWQNSF